MSFIYTHWTCTQVQPFDISKYTIIYFPSLFLLHFIIIILIFNMYWSLFALGYNIIYIYTSTHYSPRFYLSPLQFIFIFYFSPFSVFLIFLIPTPQFHAFKFTLSNFGFFFLFTFPRCLHIYTLNSLGLLILVFINHWQTLTTFTAVLHFGLTTWSHD